MAFFRLLPFFVAATLLQETLVLGYVIRTPATESFVREYVQRKHKTAISVGGDVEGKNLAVRSALLEREATTVLAKSNLNKLRPHLGEDWNAVAHGGWYRVQQLATDPKGLLVQTLLQEECLDGQKKLKGRMLRPKTTQDVETLVALLQAMGKGFTADLAHGEWKTILDQDKIQDKKSVTSCVNIEDGTLLLERKSFLKTHQTKYKYNPVGRGYSVIGKSIVTRRIEYDWVGADIKVGILPKLSRKKRQRRRSNKKLRDSNKNYLDFCYLDEDLRVTRDHQGKLTVNIRPAYYEEMMTMMMKRKTTLKPLKP